ncbi:hypothetical protein QUF75_14200 [Desulfococcaceae bacterium HSG7]|nr:hypothetical protein [Desulfococcaceae bacterium HSG7]
MKGKKRYIGIMVFLTPILLFLLFFLSNDDMAEWELKANAGVIVPRSRIPKTIKEVVK